MFMSIKTHKIMALILILTCGFIYYDSIYSPSKVTEEICEHLIRTARFNSGIRYYYYVQTNGDSYAVTRDSYDIGSIGGKVFIIKSALTGANREVRISNSVRTEVSDIRFISESGLVLLSFVVIASILFIIFYDRIPYKQGAKSVVYLLTFLTVFLLFFYLRGGARI